jgi:hypothetical protein
MTDHEQHDLEAALQRIKPAHLPETFMARLRGCEPSRGFQPVQTRPFGLPALNMRAWLRWLIPATAVVIVAATLWQSRSLPTPPPDHPAAPVAGGTMTEFPVLNADEVRIGQELVSSFDAVARLPGGEPVRFRFQQWMDQMVLSDTTQGLVVESRAPRYEVVPVRFETYCTDTPGLNSK